MTTAVLATAVLGGCGGSEPAEPGLVRVDQVGHVHAVGIDPSDRSVVIASHNGMFRAGPGDARARRLTEERRDVMGFTVSGGRQYVGSGHPDPRAGGTTSVGFIRSDDAGRTWSTVSLEGRADLHALEVSGRWVFGFDAISGRFLRSGDAGRTWAATAVPPVLDIAVAPGDPAQVVVSSAMGLLTSRDGGRSFRPLDDTPPGFVSWTSQGIVTVSLDGVVTSRRGLGEDGRTVGQVPIVPAAMTADGRVTLVAADDGTVVRSLDGGRTWTSLLAAIA